MSSTVCETARESPQILLGHFSDSGPTYLMHMRCAMDKNFHVTPTDNGNIRMFSSPIPNIRRTSNVGS